ncbi:hypothetical protein [Candidatus Hecatella orcuttiae]|uniref:hypothetical protein n=1 Tax=Candidatus Hecatella orcuttiae TaxID=1935119 RepID=UPI002867CA13|nr:hypothetical protein [Candidatus Hecatella orcuttiae]
MKLTFTKLRNGKITDSQQRMVKDAVKKLKEIAEWKNRNWKILESQVLNKRLTWFRKNKSMLKLEGTDVEKAFELLLLKIGINRDEVKIVKKSQHRIVFRSYNFCPILEACRLLGFDTREVCREAYEKSTEDFIRQVNPNLKFKRNYDKIRPYAQFCEEIIELGK